MTDQRPTIPVSISYTEPRTIDLDLSLHDLHAWVAFEHPELMGAKLPAAVWGEYVRTVLLPHTARPDHQLTGIEVNGVDLPMAEALAPYDPQPPALTRVVSPSRAAKLTVGESGRRMIAEREAQQQGGDQ